MFIRKPGAEYNTAILYNAGFADGADARVRLVEDIAARAAQKALEVSNHQLADATDATRDRLKNRHLALEAAVRSQKISPLVPGEQYGFELLHASVVRRILNENERLALSNPRSSPIVRLGPAASR